MANLTTCFGLRVVRALYRFCQCAFYGPATLESLIKRLYRHTSLICPRSHTLGATIVFKESVNSCIATLLSWRCPTTVVRLVVAIIVRVSVKCCVVRSWSHVLYKRLEGVSPPVAHFYSSATIVRVLLVGGSVAATNHRIPTCVFSRMGHAVRGKCLPCGARAAPLRFVPIDFRGSHGAFISARTLAEPFTLRSRRFFNETNNYPCFAKFLAGQVCKVVRAANRISLSHVTVPRILDVVRMARQLQLSGCSYFRPLATRGQR